MLPPAFSQWGFSMEAAHERNVTQIYITDLFLQGWSISTTLDAFKTFLSILMTCCPHLLKLSKCVLMMKIRWWEETHLSSIHFILSSSLIFRTQLYSPQTWFNSNAGSIIIHYKYIIKPQMVLQPSAPSRTTLWGNVGLFVPNIFRQRAQNASDVWTQYVQWEHVLAKYQLVSAICCHEHMSGWLARGDLSSPGSQGNRTQQGSWYSVRASSES